MTLREEQQTILGDEEVPTLLGQYREMPQGDERKKIGAQLLAWNENFKERRAYEEEEHYSEVFQDLGTARQKYGDNESLRFVADPDEMVAGAMNQQYVSSQLGKERDDVAALWPSYRASYSLQRFRKEAKTDKELYGMIGDQIKGDRSRDKTRQMLAGDVMRGLFDEITTGETQSNSSFLYKLNKENPDFAKGYRPGEEAKTLQWLNAMRDDLRERYEKYAPTAKRLYDEVTDNTGLIDEGGEGLQKISGEIAGMNKEDRDILFSSVLMAAQRSGFDPKTVLHQFGETLGRGIGGAITQTSRVMMEDGLRIKLRGLNQLDVPARDREYGGLRSKDEVNAFAVRGPLSRGGFEKRFPTTESRKKAKDEIQDQLNVIEVLRDISQLEEEADPIKVVSKSWMGQLAEKSLYGVGSSVGIMGSSIVPYIGPVLTFSAYRASNYERIRSESPNLSPEAASGYATMMAIPESIIDRFQMALILPKAPALVRTLRAMTLSKKGMVGAGTSFLKGAGVRTVGESGAELVQNFIPLVGDQIGGALNEDYAKHDFKKDLAQYVDMVPETIGSMVIMSMIGAGFGTVSDVKNGRFLLEKAQPMREVGVTEEGAANVLSKKTPEEREKAFQEEYKKRTPESIAEGVAMGNESVAKQKEVANLPGQTTLDGAVILGEPDAYGNPRMLWTVRDANGNTLTTTESLEAASIALYETRSEGWAETQATVAAMIDFQQSAADAAGRNVTYENAPLTEKRVSDILATEPESIAQMHDRMKIEGLEGVDPSQIRILGETTVEQLAEDSYQTQIRLLAGAKPQTVVEETVEGKTWESLKAGRISMDWLRSEVAGYESHSGEALMTETNQSVIEAVSKLGVAYVGDKIKDKALPQGLAKFFRELAVFFKNTFARALKLKKAIAEGAVSPDFEAFIADSVGLPIERKMETQRAKAQEALLSEVEGGKTFSITKAQDAEYLASVESGDMETSQRMVDEAAKAAGYDSPKVFHGTASQNIEAFDPEQRSDKGVDKGFYFSDSKQTAKTYQPEGGKIYQAYLKMGNSLEIEVDYQQWDGIKKFNKTNQGVLMDVLSVDHSFGNKTREITPKAFTEGGFDSILYKDIRDKGGFGPKDAPLWGLDSNIYVVANPNQIKSADPITRDESGNVIPLSQRFNSEKDSISYSIASAEHIAKIEARFAKLMKSPEKRLAMMEAAKRDLLRLMNENRDTLSAIQPKVINSDETIAQIEGDRMASLADIELEEAAAIAKSGADITEQFGQRIEEAKTKDKGAALTREANARASERKKGIEKTFAAKRRTANAKVNAEIKRVKSITKTENKNAKQSTKQAVTREKLLQAIVELDALLLPFPAEIRDKVGGFATLSKIGTGEKALRDFFVKRIGMIDKELERALKKEVIGQLKKLIDKSRPKKGANRVLKSDIGEAQVFADQVYVASKMGADETLERLSEIEGLQNADDVGIRRMAELQDEWNIVNQFGALTEKSAETLTASLRWLEEEVSTGREKWKLQEEQRIQELRKVINGGIALLGEANPADMVGKSDGFDIPGAMGSFARTHYSFTQMLGSMIGPSFAKMWGRAALRGDNAVVDFQLASEKRMEALMSSIAPTYFEKKRFAGWLKNRSISADYINGHRGQDVRISIDLARKIVDGEVMTGTADDITGDDIIISGSKLPPLTQADIDSISSELENLDKDTARKSITVEIAVRKGKPGKIQVSPLEAIQHILTWNQPDGKTKMEKWGYTQATIDQFKDGIGAKGAKVYEFLREEYDSFYALVNPVYRRLYGMNMPKSEMYAPKKYEQAGSAQDQSPFGTMDATGSTPGFAKSTVKHGNMPQTVDAFFVYWQHVAQVSNFIHFAELNREMASVMKDQDFSNALTQKFGKKAAGDLNQWREVIANSGNNAAADVAINNWLIAGVIGGQAVQALGFNIGTISKQSDAGFRAPMKLNWKEFREQLGNLSTGALWKDVVKMWNSPTISRRVQQGANPLIRYIYERARYNPSIMMDASKASMFPIQFFDGAFSSIAAGMVYRAEFDRAKSHGATDEIAERAAMSSVQDSVDDYSQPMVKSAKSLQENVGGMPKKTFMMFMSDARLKSALFVGASEDLIKGRNKPQATRHLITLGMLGLLHAHIVNMLRDTLTDDPDEDIYTPESYLYGVLTAPFSGFFLLGSAFDIAARKVTGQSVYSNSNNALAKSAEDLLTAAWNYEDFASDDPEKARRAWTRALKGVGVAGPASGIPGAVMNPVRHFMGAKSNIEKED